MTSATPIQLKVDLWLWPLQATLAERGAWHEILSDEERVRAARFVFPIHAERFTVAHGRMREVLGRVLDSDPASLQFALNAYGKPELTDFDVHFSLSHSGDWAALAVAAFPLGVDIEVIRPVERELPERFFSPAECQGLRVLPDPVWSPAFFRCWTRKEAVVKALGLGLSFPLEDFDVSFLEADPPRLRRLKGDAEAASAWHLHHFDVAAGCVGAIAARRTGWQVTMRNL